MAVRRVVLLRRASCSTLRRSQALQKVSGLRTAKKGALFGGGGAVLCVFKNRKSVRSCGAPSCDWRVALVAAILAAE